MWAIKGSLIFGMTLLCGGDIVIDSPPKITPEWEAKVFGVKNKNLDLTGSVHEMIDGLIEEHFDKEFFTHIENTIKKQPTGDGVHTEYWPNGQLKAKLPYKDGKAHGHVHGWYDNGRDAFKGFFKEGLKQGVHITFYRTALDDMTKEARILKYNEIGFLDRKQRRCHSKGCLWVSTTYKNGHVQGALEAWDLQGKQYLAADYKNGILLKDPPPPPGERPWPKMSPAEKYAREILGEFFQMAVNKYGVYLYSYGGSMPFDIEALSIGFNVVKKVTISEARELLVILTEAFKDMINQHQGIRPYLRDYPFSQQRSEVSLGFCDKKGVDHKDGNIARVIIGKDNAIFYSSDGPNSRPYTSVLQEPYEKALKIVSANKKEKHKEMKDVGNKM